MMKAIAQTQGQSVRIGFWSGFAASGFSVGTKGYGNFVSRTAIMATVSGTVSEATGGKFANGAVSGAFIHMFNDEYSDAIANRVVFGKESERPGVKLANLLARGYDNVVKALKGGALGVDRLMNLERPNDPMFNTLRYKALGNSGNIKLISPQPDLSELNINMK